MAEVPENTQRLMAAYAGPYCPVSRCRRLLIQSLASGGFRYTGQLSHIRSEKAKGPRHDPAYPAEKTNSYENLIFLCPSHHDEVDHDAIRWSVEKLEELKAKQEGEAIRRFGFTPWESRFYAVHYMNIPRLAWLAAVSGVDFPSPILGDNPLPGLALVPFMVAAEKLLKQLHPLAVRIVGGSDPAALPLGSLASFNRGIRTKNYRSADTDVKTVTLTGDVDKDPQIYFDEGAVRVVLPIDPQFITSNTAVSAFRAGRTTLAGLCQLKGYARKPRRTEVIASPLVLGLESELMSQLDGAEW